MRHKKQLLALIEGAMMIALAWVTDFLCSLIPMNFLPFGGTITIGMLPIVYYSYRHGWKWGVGAGLAFSCIQMIMSFYIPPAGTGLAVLLCVLLDYVVAFGAIGLADVFAKLCGGHRLVGYGVGGGVVCLIRFLCSFTSGIALWGSYAPEGMNVWVYSLAYNASYMLPNAILTALLAVLLCRALDPTTLRPMKKAARLDNGAK